jgi:hypothetical protein
MRRRKKQRVSMVIAGALVKIAKWDSSPVRATDSPSVRAKKRIPSTEARKATNARHSCEKAKQIMYANFNPGHLFITLSFRNEYLPKTIKETNTFVYDKFQRPLVQKRKAAGKETVWLKVVEGKHGDHRFHAHIVINAGEEEIDMIRALWTYGETNISPIRDTEHKNLSALAAYLTKEGRSERRKLGERTWTTSRNIVKPEIYHGFIEEAVSLVITDEIPTDKITIEHTSGYTIYGRWETIKVLFPAGYSPYESTLVKQVLKST